MTLQQHRMGTLHRHHICDIAAISHCGVTATSLVRPQSRLDGHNAALPQHHIGMLQQGCQKWCILTLDNVAAILHRDVAVTLPEMVYCYN